MFGPHSIVAMIASRKAGVPGSTPALTQARHPAPCTNVLVETTGSVDAAQLQRIETQQNGPVRVQKRGPSSSE